MFCLVFGVFSECSNGRRERGEGKRRRSRGLEGRVEVGSEIKMEVGSVIVLIVVL